MALQREEPRTAKVEAPGAFVAGQPDVVVSEAAEEAAVLSLRTTNTNPLASPTQRSRSA